MRKHNNQFFKVGVSDVNIIEWRACVCVRVRQRRRRKRDRESKREKDRERALVISDTKI